jgi:hypothetical protein
VRVFVYKSFLLEALVGGVVILHLDTIVLFE